MVPRRWLGACASLVLSLLLPHFGLAQTRTPAPAGEGTGVVEGSVVSEEGVGIGGALVTLEPSRLVVSTDQNGAFAFRRVPAGTYVARINLGDLEATEAGVQVRAGQATTVNKVLPRDF